MHPLNNADFMILNDEAEEDGSLSISKHDISDDFTNKSKPGSPQAAKGVENSMLLKE